MPVTAAVILALLLQPFVRLLRGIRTPEPIAAGFVVAALFAGLAVGIYSLSDPAAKWMSEMPNVVAELQKKIKAPIQEIKDAKEVVEDIVEETEENASETPNGNTGSRMKAVASAAPAAEAQAPPVQATRVSLIEVFTQSFIVLSDVAWSALIIFVLLYFLLATGSTLRENIILALATVRDKKTGAQGEARRAARRVGLSCHGDPD